MRKWSCDCASTWFSQQHKEGSIWTIIEADTDCRAVKDLVRQHWTARAADFDSDQRMALLSTRNAVPEASACAHGLRADRSTCWTSAAAPVSWRSSLPRSGTHRCGDGRSVCGCRGMHRAHRHEELYAVGGCQLSAAQRLVSGRAACASTRRAWRW
jgi:hypothetical protein